jgi:hypothetical protein
MSAAWKSRGPARARSRGLLLRRHVEDANREEGLKPAPEYAAAKALPPPKDARDALVTRPDAGAVVEERKEQV